MSVGGGIAGTLAALPMPLGSLTEPFSPRAFPGPRGMPLTPASCAGDLPGAAKRERTAPVSNTALPTEHPREKIETSCARFMGRDSLARLAGSAPGRTGEAGLKFQGVAERLTPAGPNLSM